MNIVLVSTLCEIVTFSLSLARESLGTQLQFSHLERFCELQMHTFLRRYIWWKMLGYQCVDLKWICIMKMNSDFEFIMCSEGYNHGF